jgi:hypothetical protein
MKTNKRRMNQKIVARLEKQFGYDAADAIRDIVKYGQVNWLTPQRLAAYKANLTRGTYDSCF